MNWKSTDNQQLIAAILALKDKAEAQSFLRDLMTTKEIDEFAKRLKAATMLLEKIPYSVIEKETGLSSTTVARVSKWLNASSAGYQTIINRLHHHSSIQTRNGVS